MLPYVVSERNTIMLSLDATIIYRIPALLMALTVHDMPMCHEHAFG